MRKKLHRDEDFFASGLWLLASGSIMKQYGLLFVEIASSQTIKQLNNQRFNNYPYFCGKLLNHDSKLHHLER